MSQIVGNFPFLRSIFKLYPLIMEGFNMMMKRKTLSKATQTSGDKLAILQRFCYISSLYLLKPRRDSLTFMRESWAAATSASLQKKLGLLDATLRVKSKLTGE